MVGTSLALLVLPPFIEQQRIEFEEMQNMQKKQVRYKLMDILLTMDILPAMDSASQIIL